MTDFVTSCSAAEDPILRDADQGRRLSVNSQRNPLGVDADSVGANFVLCRMNEV